GPSNGWTVHLWTSSTGKKGSQTAKTRTASSFDTSIHCGTTSNAVSGMRLSAQLRK
ncbi:hypothetical protein IscW_ISCW003754, partial [Ixodes scapularis]